MQIKTEAYSALGQLLPSQEYDVVSTFKCCLGPEDGMPEGAVLGFWVKIGAIQVEPIYLSQAQLAALQESHT
jgi:hypothetical protein